MMNSTDAALRSIAFGFFAFFCSSLVLGAATVPFA